MRNQETKRNTGKKTFRVSHGFVLGVLLFYCIFLGIAPEKAVPALEASVKVFGYILFPLCLVFVFMILLNLFSSSSQVTRLLGEKSGAKGILLSAAAGVISMGPIYAWYPLLRDLRDKGAGNIVIAVFLGNRAVKPFILPVMISYFGWEYVLLLTLFMILASVAVGYVLEILCRIGRSA